MSNSKIASVIELDRTTLPPGLVRVPAPPQLIRAITALWNAREFATKVNVMTVELLRRQKQLHCPQCAREASVDGYRRTVTSYAEREEWRCGSCSAHFVLSDVQSC
jgi:transposase-like protein